MPILAILEYLILTDLFYIGIPLFTNVVSETANN